MTTTKKRPTIRIRAGIRAGGIKLPDRTIHVRTGVKAGGVIIEY